MSLLELWLRNRSAFVEVSVDRSMLYSINIGTVQGSILGPVLFSLFVSPVFELSNIVAYADDTYMLESSRSKENLVTEIGDALTTILLWFQSSGLKVNEAKTEIVIFHKDNCNLENVLINGTVVRTKATMKVLGTTIDTTLTWNERVNNVVSNV
jgi:hypothetical protein